MRFWDDESSADLFSLVQIFSCFIKACLQYETQIIESLEAFWGILIIRSHFLLLLKNDYFLHETNVSLEVFKRTGKSILQALSKRKFRKTWIKQQILSYARRTGVTQVVWLAEERWNVQHSPPHVNINWFMNMEDVIVILKNPFIFGSMSCVYFIQAFTCVPTD